MIDTVYRTVQVMLNKNGKGVITPDRFNTLADAAQTKVISSLADEYRRIVTRRDKGYNAKTLNVVKTAYDIFLKSETIQKEGDIFKIPEDCNVVESVFIGEKDAEIVPFDRFKMFSRNVDEYYPIASYGSDGIIVSPSSIESVELIYRRVSKKPKWTYISIAYNDLTGKGENIVFNPTDVTFQDFELPETYMASIIDEILTALGLHFKEADLLQVAQSEKQNELRNETV